MSISMSTHLPTFVLAAAAVLAVSGCGIDMTFGHDTSTRTEHASFAADDVAAIEVRTENGPVTIGRSTGDSIDVTAIMKESSDARAAFVTSDDDGVLTVEGRCDRGWWDRCSVGFEIEIPARFDVDATSANGRITIEHVDGRVRLTSDNGAVVGHHLSADVVEVHTDNGAIELTFDDPPDHVRAVTDNGAIVMALAPTADGYDVDVRSDNGGIDVGVRTDPSSARRIMAETDNGAISIGQTDVSALGDTAQD